MSEGRAPPRTAYRVPGRDPPTAARRDCRDVVHRRYWILTRSPPPWCSDSSDSDPDDDSDLVRGAASGAVFVFYMCVTDNGLQMQENASPLVQTGIPMLKMCRYVGQPRGPEPEGGRRWRQLGCPRGKPQGGVV